MKYVLDKKEIEIPDEEIEKLIETLDLSLQEAIETWLDDNDYISNEEAAALTKKAKDNKVLATIHQAKSDKPRAKTTRERKANPNKEMIIAEVAKLLPHLGVENLKIENAAKIITFELNGESFKLDLIQKRKGK